MLLSAMAGRQLPIVSLIVPAWLVVTMSGWQGLRGVWPAVLVSGGSFAIVQFLWSNYVGPELVDIVGGLVSLGVPGAVLRVVAAGARRGISRTAAGSPAASGGAGRAARRATRSPQPRRDDRAAVRPCAAWMPWVFLSRLRDRLGRRARSRRS